MTKAPRLSVALLAASTATVALAAGAAPSGGQLASDVPAADFEKIHAVTAADPNRFLVLGGIALQPPAADLSSDLRPFLGRWEGYNTNPPVKKDLKVALVIRSIDGDRADAFIYYGYNLQYPTAVRHIAFKVSKGEGVSLEAGADTGSSDHIQLALRQGAETLTGELSLGGGAGNYVGSTSVNSIELSRTSSYYVYKDYQAYLAGIRIHPESHGNADLNKFGNGYLVYLPPGYETDTGKRWPLMLFMHGMGDRGDNLLLVVKASPFKMIREKGPLPFIIVAPLLSGSPEFFSFPGKYIEGVLDEVAKRYRIDEKRVYLTGLSLGGEAAYRYSLQHPERIAAMASLGGMLAIHVPQYYSREIKELEGVPLSRLRGVAAWQIHGTGDAIVPVQLARRLVDEFARSGVQVRYTELTDHEHDVWSDTFADPAFYDWFLQHAKK